VPKWPGIMDEVRDGEWGGTTVRGLTRIRNSRGRVRISARPADWRAEKQGLSLTSSGLTTAVVLTALPY
jgi:hypothetical protein